MSRAADLLDGRVEDRVLDAGASPLGLACNVVAFRFTAVCSVHGRFPIDEYEAAGELPTNRLPALCRRVLYDGEKLAKYGTPEDVRARAAKALRIAP